MRPEPRDIRRCKVLVTPTSFGMDDPTLRSALAEQVDTVIYNPTARPLSSGELAALLPGCDGYIAGLDKIDREALQAADRLRVIARYGVGVDNVDLEVAREKGIVVTNTPFANAVSVAELTVALILSLARLIPTADAAVRAGTWPRFSGATLQGKTVGLLGFGRVGKLVAQRLLGFDCSILAYDPIGDMRAALEHKVRLVSQEEAVTSADWLSLHLPLVPETRHMVNAAFIAHMKRGAFLVNTARGEIVDETALCAALRSGHLRGAALDVFAHEPMSAANNELLTLPSVIVTPHMGAHTDGATNAMGSTALADCLAVLRGETPKFRVV